MEWVTVTWSMAAAACMTLAVMHFVIWVKQRTAWGQLLFSCSAVAATVMAGFELASMHAKTTAQYGTLIRWAHLPLFVMIVSLVCFVRLYLGAGRVWLAWAVVAVRTLALVLNFVFSPNLNYREITSIRQMKFLGGQTVSVAVGKTNPWTLVGQFSSLLLLIFLVDALIALWRRGDRRRAVVLCGSMVLFIAVAAGHAALVMWGAIHTPFFVSIAYLGVIAAMGYELSADVVRAALVSRQLETSKRALHESHQLMDLAAGAARITMWRWDIASDEIWMSKQARELFGFAGAAPINFDRLLQAVYAEDRDPVMHCITHSLKGDGDYANEFRIPLADGRLRWISDRGRVEFDDRGKPVRMHGASIDITARKQAELEAQQQRAELTHLSRVTMLGELSASLAHELNQPLTAILSNAQAAQRFLAYQTVDLDEVRAILKDIVDDDNRAGEVIRRMRQLFKKGELQTQDLDVNETVLDVLRLVHSDLVNRGVVAETELKRGLPAISADRVQIQQVLLNLIMNGCDAIADAIATERRLVLRTASPDGAAVHISITDSGCGIPPERLEQVFTPFFTTKPHGMGLGLAVCRTIISAHGGRLWATNEAQRGASFHLALPAKAVEGIA